MERSMPSPSLTYPGASEFAREELASLAADFGEERTAKKVPLFKKCDEMATALLPELRQTPTFEQPRSGDESFLCGLMLRVCGFLLGQLKENFPSLKDFFEQSQTLKMEFPLDNVKCTWQGCDTSFDLDKIVATGLFLSTIDDRKVAAIFTRAIRAELLAGRVELLGDVERVSSSPSELLVRFPAEKDR
jgi:hypothetical protein